MRSLVSRTAVQTHAVSLWPIHVASVPASHVYVRHLSPPGNHWTHRLPDPLPRDGRKVPGGWWPPLMLDPAWIRDNQSRFEVFHIHCGFGSLSTEQMGQVIRALQIAGKPLVYTVHDLRNPHQPDRRAHDRHLDLLVDAAVELITLTNGAAYEIKERWQRNATVLPHPHVVPPAYLLAERPPRLPGSPFVIGVHAKSIRANMAIMPVLQSLADSIRRWPDALLRVDLHDEVFDPDSHWYAPRVGNEIRAMAQHPQVEVRVHPPFTDDQLWDYLRSLDVSVLPYAWGTHSAWLEACHDLGTAVAAPSCGYYGDQRECAVFHLDEDGLDGESLASAVERTRERLPVRPTWQERLNERYRLARAHLAIYSKALGSW